jgi:antitoxin (DNA-binding transcriptional repressor) of toxin-antitoxin stability system
MIHMKTATVRELRTAFPKVERWIAEGEQVKITKRRKIVALLVPPARATRRRRPLPDFAARVRVTFGKRKLTFKQSADLRVLLRGER